MVLFTGTLQKKRQGSRKSDIGTQRCDVIELLVWGPLVVSQQKLVSPVDPPTKHLGASPKSPLYLCDTGIQFREER